MRASNWHDGCSVAGALHCSPCSGGPAKFSVRDFDAFHAATRDCDPLTPGPWAWGAREPREGGRLHA
jgi:hypothetical protein